MAELTPELTPQVIAACTENGEEAAGALSRAFDGEFVVKPGVPGLRDGLSADALTGPGLAFAFKFGEESTLAVLSASGGIVPEWTQSPDDTGKSKLATLGQELSMLFFPETLMADSYQATWVEDLAAAVERAGAASDATTMPIEIAKGETLGQILLLWPVTDANAALATSQDASEPEATPQAATAEDCPAQSRVLRGDRRQPTDYRDLPPNSISALRVSVPVSVNLAGKKMSLGDVVELGPGSIIAFDKSCDAPIEVAVGEHPIAKGEAAKVGERFGVRILEMILPEEHFRPMLPPRAS